MNRDKRITFIHSGGNEPTYEEWDLWLWEDGTLKCCDLDPKYGGYFTIFDSINEAREEGWEIKKETCLQIAKNLIKKEAGKYYCNKLKYGWSLSVKNISKSLREQIQKLASRTKKASKGNEKYIFPDEKEEIQQNIIKYINLSLR